MGKKEKLIYAVENLESILDEFLDVSNEIGIDEAAYEQISKNMNSVINESRNFFYDDSEQTQQVMF